MKTKDVNLNVAIVNVFNVTFRQFNAVLLNKSLHFLKNLTGQKRLNGSVYVLNIFI